MKKSLLLGLFISFCSLANANNMLVQNVTTLGNDPVNKTIQVQFDISWDNSWRDAINWDAAWIFMKFKDANGLWQHAQLNQTGFANGIGTANTLQVTSDKVGSWLYRSAQGSGTFNSTGMQLQWSYGLAGLSNVSGLEVRVFAVEMVYVPEGDFSCAGKLESSYTSFNYSNGYSRAGGIFIAPGNNFPVINSQVSPTLTYNDGNELNFKIRGNTGIDFNNDGVIENSNYPRGYNAFYCYKYELTEQQYADLLNTLTEEQISILGLAGSSITITDGQYFSSTPNKACNNSTATRLLVYADWSGIRPMSFLEFQKVSYGPLQPQYNSTNNSNSTPDGFSYNVNMRGYPAWGGTGIPNNFNILAGNAGSTASEGSTRLSAGASYYGAMDLTGSAIEPVVSLNAVNFSELNGDGNLLASGYSNVNSWDIDNLLFIDTHASNILGPPGSGIYLNPYSTGNYGFRYVRSAE
jgi:hypothetical protein